MTFNTGCTLLHAAVQANKLEAVRVLLDARVSIVYKDYDGQTAVDLAVTLKNLAPDVLNAFISDEALFNKAFKGTANNICDRKYCFQTLLESGARINARSRLPPKHTALHEAVVCCDSQFTKIVAQLLKGGADVNFTDQNGATPLHWICKFISESDTARAHKLVAKTVQQLFDNLWLVILAGCKRHVLQCASTRTAATNLARALSLTTAEPEPRHLAAFCIQLALGDNFSLPSVDDKMALEKALLVNGATNMEFAVETGFKFKHIDVIQQEGDCDVTEERLRKLNRPLTLKRLAANVIRLRLQPNPFVGVKKLSLPPGFDRSYITIMRERDENFTPDVFARQSRERAACLRRRSTRYASASKSDHKEVYLDLL